MSARTISHVVANVLSELDDEAATLSLYEYLDVIEDLIADLHARKSAIKNDIERQESGEPGFEA